MEAESWIKDIPEGDDLFGEGLAHVAKNPDLEDCLPAFARVFSSEDGQKVLEYLIAETYQAMPQHAPDEILRFQEGKRAMIERIMVLTEKGRNPSHPPSLRKLLKKIFWIKQRSQSNV